MTANHNIYKIYVAGSFANEQSRKSLAHMIEIVKKKFAYPISQGNVELFIPMEHKIEGDFQNPDGTWNLTNPEWARRVYAMDMHAIDECDLIIAMYTGHYSTTGTAFEIGYALAKGKKIAIYVPEWAKENNASLMILNSAHMYMTEDGIIRKMNDKFLEQFNQK